MKRATSQRDSHRAALVCIIAFQLTHCVLQLRNRWGPPRKNMAKMYTAAKLNEFVWTSVVCYRLTEGNFNIKLGRWMIREGGVLALLWCVAIWSAAVVTADVTGCSPDNLWGLVQMAVLDVIMSATIVSKAVGLIEREEKDVLPVVEKRPLK